MNPEAQSLRMAIYFGLPVEVIHQMESWTLIRFSGAKFVVDTTDLVVDPEMAAEQVETPAPIMVGGEGDSRKRMAAGREQSSDPALSGQTLGVHRCDMLFGSNPSLERYVCASATSMPALGVLTSHNADWFGKPEPRA
jgi:hypothetical protein